MRFLKERIGEILKQLYPLCFPRECSAAVWKGQEGDFGVKEQVPEGVKEWPEADVGRLGAGSSAHFGLYQEIQIPGDMDKNPVELCFSTGREGEWDATNPQIAAYVNGELRQGLDVNHRRLLLSECAKAGERICVFLSVYTGETGNISCWDCKLRAIDRETEKFYYDLLIPWQCLALYPEEERAYEELLGILNDTVNLLDMRKPGSREFKESIRKSDEFLQAAVEKLPVSEITASCVGHTHIDVAWLWTLAVTREKAARSFATVQSLMERYPSYCFMSSQPQLYKYVKKNQPRLYEKIRQRVKEGRWEPEGGMFLEADCNLTSGESLVRQFLYGKQFFREEFGVDSKILWLPDVFGYSAALPQIMKKCGVNSFMTTKISWNETNQIPFDTFWWEGIDGTRILTHFITTRDYDNRGQMAVTGREYTKSFTTNYNGCIHPSQVKGAWQRYQQKGLNTNVLIAYGFGDGGGGPTEEMLETAERLKEGRFGCPAVKQEGSAAFFERLHQTAEKVKFPLWSGELYLEFHRGTYTSMAENKRNNRRGEVALLNAESWAVLANRLCGLPYPKEELAQAWEILMRNQFHDILPGSAIAEVYEDSRKEYEQLFYLTDNICGAALKALTEETDAGAVTVFNPNGTEISGLVKISGLPESNGGRERLCAMTCGGDVMPVQRTEEGSYLFRALQVPSKGFQVFHPLYGSEGMPEIPQFYSSAEETVTPYYKICWNEKGQMTSFYDRRTERELLKEGECGNVLMTYEDKPYEYDNWNIDEYYQEKSWPVEELVSAEVEEQGTVRMVLKFVWNYLDSVISERVILYPDSPRIDLRFEADWQESQILLKLLFPLKINTGEAVFDIQYGNVKRSTTRNHSWEQARFEVCYQKWMDVSEYGYGVSFLSDSKYGVGISENEVGLTLLKAGCYPNPKADRGHHEFAFGILPHEGGWQEAGTVQEAYELNNPLTACMGDAGKSSYSDICVSEKNIIAEVQKQAENGEGEIVRLYECHNRTTRADIAFGQKVRQVWLCNMLEEPQQELETDGTGCRVSFGPFEIVTLKIIR